VTEDELEELERSPLLDDPELSVALSVDVDVVVVVVVETLAEDARFCSCTSWTTRPATPPTPTTTIPTVAWVRRRAPRARTLLGLCTEVMAPVVPPGTERCVTLICASAVRIPEYLAKWGESDSNRRPRDYESPALTS
jgi:hypothetical protein